MKAIYVNTHIIISAPTISFTTFNFLSVANRINFIFFQTSLVSGFRLLEESTSQHRNVAVDLISLKGVTWICYVYPGLCIELLDLL